MYPFACAFARVYGPDVAFCMVCPVWRFVVEPTDHAVEVGADTGADTELLATERALDPGVRVGIVIGLRIYRLFRQFSHFESGR